MNMGVKKGSIPWNKGLSKETDERVRKHAHQPRKPLSEETKEKISKANKGRKTSYKPSKEHIEKIRIIASKPKSKESIEKAKITKAKNGYTVKGEKNPNYRGGKIQVFCNECGQEIFKNKSELREFNFCNINCKVIWWNKNKRGENSTNWKGGSSILPYPSVWTFRFRELIRNLYGNICQVCGKINKEDGKNLAIHHIDYDKQNCNHYNLIPLCKKCHAKTNGNRDYWKNYFSSKVINLYT